MRLVDLACNIISSMLGRWWVELFLGGGKADFCIIHLLVRDL